MAKLFPAKLTLQYIFLLSVVNSFFGFLIWVCIARLSQPGAAAPFVTFQQMFLSMVVVSALTLPRAVSRASANDWREKRRYIIAYLFMFPPLCVAIYIVILLRLASR
jgi:ABC-type arginine/histidine transport system permease subunit